MVLFFPTTVDGLTKHVWGDWMNTSGPILQKKVVVENYSANCHSAVVGLLRTQVRLFLLTTLLFGFRFITGCNQGGFTRRFSWASIK